MKLIDATIAADKLSAAYNILMADLVDTFATVPAVDAVPVVRCRDCKHMRRDNVGVFCKVWDGYNGCGYDGFCNYGERVETPIPQERRWMETI